MIWNKWNGPNYLSELILWENHHTDFTLLWCRCNLELYRNRTGANVQMCAKCLCSISVATATLNKLSERFMAEICTEVILFIKSGLYLSFFPFTSASQTMQMMYRALLSSAVCSPEQEEFSSPNKTSRQISKTKNNEADTLRNVLWQGWNCLS